MIVVGLGEPDRRWWTAVERYEAALQVVREQRVVLVVFTAHERSDAIPDDQVVTPSKHWSYRAVASPVSAVRRVAHVTRAIKFDDVGVFDSENLKRALERPSPKERSPRVRVRVRPADVDSDFGTEWVQIPHLSKESLLRCLGASLVGIQRRHACIFTLLARPSVIPSPTFGSTRSLLRGEPNVSERPPERCV